MKPLRIIAKTLLGIVGAVVVVVVLGVAVVQIPFTRGMLVDWGLKKVNQSIPGTVSLRGLDGNLFTHILLHDLRVRDGDKTVAVVERVDIYWNPLDLLDRTLSIESIEVVELRANLEEREGQWNIVSAFSEPSTAPATEEEQQTSGDADWEVQVDDVRLADVAVGLRPVSGPPRRIEVTTARFNLSAKSGQAKANLASLTASLSEPDLYVRAVSGTIRVVTKPILTVSVDDLRAELRESRLLIDGALAFTADAPVDLRVEVSPLAPVDAKPLGSPLAVPLDATAIVAGSWRHLDVDFQASTTAGTIRAAGTASLPFTQETEPAWALLDLALTGTVSELEPSLWVGNKAERPTRVTADFKVKVDDVASPKRVVQAQFEGSRSTVGGYAVRDFHGRGRYADDAVTGVLKLDSPRGYIDAEGTFDIAGNAYAGTATVKDVQPEDWLGKKWAGQINAEVIVEAKGTTLDTLLGKVHVKVTDTQVGPYHLARVRIPATIKDGFVFLDEAHAQTNVADLRLEGKIPFQRGVRGEAKLLVRVPDLANLTPDGVTEGSQLTGRAMAVVRLSGTPERLAIHGTLHGLGIEYGENAVVDADFEFEARHINVYKQTGQIETFGTLTAPKVAGQAFVKSTVAVSLDRTKRNGDVDQEGTFLVTAVRQGLESRLRGRFELHPETTGLVFEDFLLGVNGNEWINQGEARIDIDESSVVIENMDLRNGEQQILVDGSISPGGTQNLRARLNRLQLRQFRDMVQFEDPLSGQLDAAVWLSGTLDSPKLEATFALSEANIGGYDVELITLVGSYADRWMNLNVRLMQSGDAGLLLTNLRVPIDLSRAPPGGKRVDSRPLEGTIRSERLSLALIEATGLDVSDVSGTIDLDATVAGTLKRPQIRGRLSLQNGSLDVEAAGVAYPSLIIEANFDGDTVELTRLRIVSENDGVLTAKGTIGLPFGRAAAPIALDVAANNFLVIDNEMAEAVANADLNISGTVEHPTVRGDISSDRILITPPESGSKRLADLEYDVKGVRVVSPGDDPLSDEVKDGKKVQAPLLERATVNVRLEVERNAWIRNDAMNFELRGDLRAYKETGQKDIRLAGEINVVRGFYRLQGKRLELSEGVITFPGTAEFNPNLDILLTYKAPEYEAFIEVTGTTKNPRISLSSRPPLEQADVVAVILFGKPFEQLGGGEQVEMRDRVAGLLGGIAAEQLRKALGGKLGIDVLEIEPAEDDAEGAAVGVGKYVAEDVFVQYVQQFGADAGSEVRLEYFFAKNWVVQTSASTGGESGVDIFWTISF